MGWVSGVYGEMRNSYRILVGKLEGKNHLQDLGIDGRIVLRWILGKYDFGLIGFTWFRIRTDGGLL
jgi:hypothetical protein